MLGKKLKISFLAAILAALLSGCSFSFPWEKQRSVPIDNVMETEVQKENSATIINTSFSGDLRKFSNEDSLRNFLAQVAPAGGLTSSWLLAENGYGSADDAASLKLAGGATSGFIGADMVKIEGNYAYVLVRDAIKIISLNPVSAAQVVGQINLPHRPWEFFVADSRLVVFGSDNKSQYFQDSIARVPGKYTFLKIFDVSLPTNPKEIRSLSFEGGYVGTRLSGNYTYLLTASPAYYIDGANLTPLIIENGRVVSGNCVSGQNCHRPQVFHFDTDYRNYTFLSVTAVNIADSSEPLNSQAFIVDTNFNIHLSLSGNFFLTRTEALSLFSLEQEIKREIIFPLLSEEEKTAIKSIENSPAFILSSAEKSFKSNIIIDRYFNSLPENKQNELRSDIEAGLLPKIKQRAKEIDKTDIYKFSLKAGKINYQAKGSVDGNVLVVGSLDEKNDYLRLVTTRSELFSRLFKNTGKIYNNVYILDAGLKLIGVLENIVTEASLRSVNFIGNRVYIATTNQEMPVYVLNLADAAKPDVLGAVRVKGYSYIYPADNKGERIISVGRESATDPLKLSLFDFSDLQKPKELSSYLIGDNSSVSIAMEDYKALYFSPTSGIIVLPAAFKDGASLTFSGALVFSSEQDNLNLKRRLDHSVGNRFLRPDSWRGFNYYDNTVKRSWLSGENLFTFSNKYLKIHRLPDLSEVKTITLTPGGDEANINQALIDVPVSREDAPVGADNVTAESQEGVLEFLPEQNQN